MKWRTPGKRLLDRIFDLAIIGGGINGCGIARDAAGRGNSVFLCEMNDLASGTSSWSTKLVHGGLRYLEYYEFRLVREALIEREILWQIAPHIIRPLRFVLPHHAGPAPGLAAAARPVPVRPYRRPEPVAADPLGRSDQRRGRKAAGAQPLHQGLRIFRLLRRRRPPGGARPRATPPIAAPTSAPAPARSRSGRPTAIWHVTVENTLSGAALHHPAPARWSTPAGPGSSRCWRSGAGVNAKAKVRLVQGSHIVVRKLYAP